MSVEPETEGLTNYVVNLRSGNVIGKTMGSHFGDKPTYNAYSNDVAWSGEYFAQVCTGKWATFDANVYQLNGDGAVVSNGTDLLVPAKKAAMDHLDGSDLFKKFDKEDFTITLHDVRIVQHGFHQVIIVEVGGMIPKSEEEGSYFECTVIFKLASGENDGPPVLTLSGTELHHE